MKVPAMRSLPALICALFSGVASAAAFQASEQSASGLGTNYAGSAAQGEDASAQAYNPATLMLISRPQLSAGVTAKFNALSFHDAAGKQGGDAGQTVMLPNFFVATPMSDTLSLGFSVTRPYAGKSEFESGWKGASVAEKTELKTLSYNPSLAYKVNDVLALGWGLNYLALDLDLTKTGMRFSGDDHAWGWNAGAVVTLSPAMRLGFAYRSATDFTVDGKNNGNVASTRLHLPATFTMSVWQQVSDRWEAMGDLSWTNWQRFDDLRVVDTSSTTTEAYRLNNSWRFAWGTAYQASDLWKLKFGLGYERSPLRNENRTARLPDADVISVSAGAQWITGPKTRLDLGYSYRYSRDKVLVQGPLIGSVESGAHVVGLQYSVAF